MKVGFTGTSKGMNQNQKRLLPLILEDINENQETGIVSVHHGDCIGADAEFHDICTNLEFHPEIFIHPPDDDKKRAFKESDYIFGPKPYIKRNHDIVDSTGILIVVPSGNKVLLRSGTWATYRYAMKQGKMIVVINPDGTFRTANWKE